MDSRYDAQRNTAISELRYAWQMMLPGVPVPDHKYLGIWCFHANDSGLALEAIEKTASANARQQLLNPAGFCWSLLKTLINRRIRQAAQ